MRTLAFIITVFILSLNLSAQQNSVKTVTLGVSGDCDECKANIENAADIKGVKLCVWNSKSQQAVITYDESKVSLEKIEQAIANKGYDTEHLKASETAYYKLPKCCQYRGNTEGLHKK
ncbi:MAG TPA: heavy-metal-associated domain-containing protein [Bacteroidia bacterium]|nr:heavy-metal-associated domain-containing protein [Bacteroidia bacterium]